MGRSPQVHPGGFSSILYQEINIPLESEKSQLVAVELAKVLEVVVKSLGVEPACSWIDFHLSSGLYLFLKTFSVPERLLILLWTSS